MAVSLNFGQSCNLCKKMVGWSEIPADLLVLIARRLHFAEDYARFGAVCKSWRAVIVQKDSHSCSLLPCLMLPENEANNRREFYGPFNSQVYELDLPEIRGRRCWGSSQGWLVTLDAEYRMQLLNPMSRVQILLPPLHKCSNLKNLICSPEEFRNTFVYKVVLSSNPYSGNCVVLAIYSDNKMAFAKPGDEAWTPLQCCPSVVNDAICFRGNFYATDSSGDVVICDPSGCHVKTVAITSSFLTTHELDEAATYIVELDGRLHVLLRIMYDARYADSPFLRTWSFNIYELDVRTERWEEVRSLSNWSIFVGSNHSFSISCSDYPECSSNCIYFTDDYSGLYYDSTTCFAYDMGIFSLDNQKIRPLLQEEISLNIFSQPVWMKPTF